ncbi:MAG: XdhC family protein [Pseudomonadota bacterium]
MITLRRTKLDPSWQAIVGQAGGDTARDAVRVLVLKAEGSTPRSAGAAMVVFADDQCGTIGGGRLEFEAAKRARSLLAEDARPWRRHVEAWPLGPNLGQCCGGHVTLLFEVTRADERRSLAAQLSETSEAVALRRRHASGQPPELVTVAAASDSPIVVSDSVVTEAISTPLTPLFLYGAGHVGRALADILQPLDFEIVWVDI